MLLTGFTNAISYDSVPITGGSELKLTVPQSVETFRTLAEPIDQGVGVRKDWSCEAQLEDVVAAATRGTVTAGMWTGVFLKEWSAEVEMALAEAPGHDEEWIQYAPEGFSWKVTATKFEDTTSKHVFLNSLIEQSAEAVVDTPVIGGNVWYDEAGAEGKAGPREETLSLVGVSLFTSQDVWDAIVDILLGYRTSLLAAAGVEPKAIALAGFGSGLGFIQKLAASSDGKRLRATVSVQGSGAFSPEV